MKKRTPFIYCIFRLDRKFYQDINKDLRDFGYKKVEAIVPTVSILKKSRKGKDTYEDIPLLFNYGFIRMRAERGYDRNFLNRVKRDIPGILSWMKSPETIHPKKIKRRVDNAEDFDDFSMVATISKAEVKRFIQLSEQNKIYSAEDITQLSIGDYITLRGYPFEGISATVDNINLVTKLIEVTIYPGTGSLTVKIPWDNILYSIYHDYDEYRLQATDEEPNLGQIPDGSTEEILTSKQY